MALDTSDIRHELEATRDVVGSVLHSVGESQIGEAVLDSVGEARSRLLNLKSSSPPASVWAKKRTWMAAALVAGVAVVALKRFRRPDSESGDPEPA